MGDLILTSKQYDRLLEGTWVTIQVLAAAVALGVVLSLIFGVARLSPRAWVRGLALVYVEFARGISSIVLLFIMAYALPILFELEQASVFVLGSIALGVNMGGYGAEIIRGAIQSVPKGQTEATIALNMTRMQRLRYVVLPQAMRVILPPMGNLTIEILKGTALVSLVALSDLAFEADKLIVNRTRSENPVEVPALFLNVLVMYFVMAQVVNLIFKLAERRVESKYRGSAAAIDPAEAANLDASSAGVVG